jgi:hypothetical protein
MKEKKKILLMGTVSLLIVLAAVGSYYTIQSTNHLNSETELIKKIQDLKRSYPWMAIGLDQINFSSGVVPIVMMSIRPYPTFDQKLDTYNWDALNALTDIIEKDVNDYSQKIGSKYHFNIVPFPVINTAEGVNASIQALNDLGLKFVVQDEWTISWKTSLNIINDNNMIDILGYDTSNIVDKFNGVYGIRPNISTGAYYHSITSEMGVNTLIILKNYWSKAPIEQRQIMENQYSTAIKEYKELGGVVYKEIIYPNPEMVDIANIQNNDNFSKYLDEAEIAVQNATEIYGKGKVGILVFGLGISPMIYQSRDKPSLMNVLWFGDELSQRSGLRFGSNSMLGPFAEEVGCFLPIESIENTSAVEKLVGELSLKLNMSSYPFFSEDAVKYDGSWLIALSVLKADSIDPEKVEGAFPLAAAQYNGLNGNYAINDKGVKITSSVDIFRVNEVSPGVFLHIMWGKYNSKTGILIENTTIVIP